MQTGARVVYKREKLGTGNFRCELTSLEQISAATGDIYPWETYRGLYLVFVEKLDV